MKVKEKKKIEPFEWFRTQNIHYNLFDEKSGEICLY